MGKMKHIPLLLLAAVLAVGCSQDELFDPAGEGQRPLVIKATGLSVTETGITRATVDGDWKDASSVGILIDNKVKEYSVTPNADAPSTATLSAAQGVEPFYWVNEQETKNVKAWYPYKEEDAFPTEITVSENQSTKEGFEGSDRLSAENPLTENDCELEFSHRVAKVTFKLKGESTALNGLSDVTVVGVTGVDDGGNSVTPYQPDAAVHTYQVLLAPQTLAAGKTALTLTKDNFTYAWIPDKDYKLEENYSYTFELTVAANNPQITLTGCTISGWELGASYEENVPIPDSGVKVYVNLAELAEEYVINDDECYVFSGSGSYGIKVTGGIPDINLENAQISVSSGHAIDIQGGNPTIHVRGKDNQVTVSKGEGAGIYVAENYTVTITGNSTEDAISVTGSEGGAGIGGQWDTTGALRCSCGNINISNVTITAKGSMSGYGDCASGIGAAGGGTVGSISISNAIVYAEGGGTAKYGQEWDYCGAAAIGGGSDGHNGGGQTEFDITISNSTIHATKSCSYATYIGRQGEKYDPANYDIISSARITNSTIYKYAYGPSEGDPPSSDGSVVYDANGNRTDQ